MIKKMITVLVLMVSLNVSAKTEREIVESMIVGSQLVSCKDNLCFDVVDDEPYYHSIPLPDGFTIMLPTGLVTEEEMEMYKTYVMEYWKLYQQDGFEK